MAVGAVIVASLGSILVSVALAQAATSVAVPFVGCAADGQMGPIPAPTPIGATPTVRAAAGARLAYYSLDNLGVLAPRGWHCFGLYGSNGLTLVVTPEPHDADDLLRPETRLTGPVVELSSRSGGTSGRFEVARIAARIFPAARPFVQHVIDEGIEPKEEFPFGPYPDDRLIRRSATEVAFVTPRNSEGLGTSGGIAKNGQPIRGVAILLAADDMGLIRLCVRLPSEMRNLSAAIIATVEHAHQPLKP
jgi:hypothetical protein